MDNLEHIDCDLCGSSDNTVVASSNDKIHGTSQEVFSVVKCDGCGLVFTNPRPKASDMMKYYSTGYSFHNSEPRLKSLLRYILTKYANSAMPDVFPASISRVLARHVKKRIIDPFASDNISPLTKFCDIGCGSGVSAHYWGPSGSLIRYKKLCQVTGVEPHDSARNYLKNRGIKTYPDIDSIPETETFDCIRMNWSLEHVMSPSSYFDFISTHLKNTGFAIICVPNYDGIIYKISPSCLELPIHTYHFTPKSIGMYCEKFDFDIISLNTFSYPAMMVFANKLGLINFPSLNGLTLSSARQMQRMLNDLDSQNLGNDMIIKIKKADNL